MSLQVWLPLTEDTKNQGLLNLPTPWDARTRDTGGKLGQYCYSDNAIYHIENEWLGNEWSLACWVKSSSWGQYNDIILCKNTTSSNKIQFYLSIIGGTWLNISCNSGGETLKINYTFDTNIWYHIAATYDGTTLKLYLNGNEIGTKAYTSTQETGMNNLGIGCRSTNATGTSATGGASKRMNDVRIYDHCLSPLEVKHIAQGLILHYPLNRNGWGQENLIANSNVEKSGKGGLILYDLTTTGINTVLGKTMRISADIKSDMINSILDCYVRSSSSQSMCSNTIFTNIGTDYKRYSMTTICNTNQSLTPQWFAFRSNGSNGTTSTATFTIKNVKLEIGENTTPWSPASSDVLATTMGLNDIVEYDTSGYCNNGTRKGTSRFSWTSDTPKYSVSQIFSGIHRIEAPFNPGNSPTFTVAGWFYHTGGTTYYGAKNSYNTFICLEGGRYFVYNSTGSAYVGYWTSTANTWQHVVLVHDAVTAKLKLYINGNFVSEVTTNGTIYGSDILDIGGRQGAAQYSGKMSDFRIYATALSADDVKSLYNNSAYIDNQGNIYGAVYEEV